VHNFLGDTVITPPEHAPYYSEKLIYLPGIFLSTSAATTTPEALTFDPNLDIPRAGLDLPMQVKPPLRPHTLVA
jgi:predicted O-linked N-acetylglucosamine transferase (SPINDLY family)